jgi:superfamily II DNA/RNA helicase
VAKGVGALILTPTRELCQQTALVIRDLCHYCSEVVSGASSAARIPTPPPTGIGLLQPQRVGLGVLLGSSWTCVSACELCALCVCAAVDISGGHVAEQVAKLAGKPDIVISTPGRLVPHIQEGA